MKQNEFEKVVNEQLDYCRYLLVEKCKEYATGVDRLNAFKKAGALQDVSPKEALAGMMAKHTFSMYEMCHDENHSIEKWTEKITDHINYLLLLKAIVIEEQENNIKGDLNNEQL